MNKNHNDKRLNQLPSWLWSNSTTLPPIYRTVWEAVREDHVRPGGMPMELLVDTNKVFPLLLTSQLPTEVLGHIWSLANQKYAGQLTEQELYIVLALVGAAQASYPFNRLDVLHLLPFPPTPYLNIECILNIQPTVQVNSAMKFHAFMNEETNIDFVTVDGKLVADGKAKMKCLHENTLDINAVISNVSTKNTYEMKSHSAPVGDVNNTLKDTKQIFRNESDIKQVPSVDPSDDFSEFQSAPIPNIPIIPIWDPKQGSAIGSRLANHNLGVKKSVEKSKKNNVGSKTVSALTRNPLVTLNPIPTIKDQPSTDCSTELFPKCNLQKQSKTVILKDTAIRSSEMAKDYTDNFTNDQVAAADKALQTKIELSERINMVTTTEESNSAQNDLMNLQLVEDKYSALRALVQEASSTAEEDSALTHTSSPIDEFGEFISAGQLSGPTLDTVNIGTLTDIFSDFELSGHRDKIGSDGAMDLKSISGVTESFDNFKLEDVTHERSVIDDKVELPVETGKSIPKEDAISINSIDFINSVPGGLTRSGSVPSLDLKSFLPTNVEDEQPIDNLNQTIYWEWKQYMESCVLLLQVAANIFTNITSEPVLNEVLNSAQGYNFLCNLAEVAAVCRRVNFSYKEMDINIMGFDDLLMDIDRIWAEMEPFYTNIPIVTELPVWPLHQGDSIPCCLCLTVITGGRVIYNENNYHATCANLWFNCVNNHLPTMRYPSFYSHTSMCSATTHI